MAVGIEERMVPHMENKKQDCKKIEELKRQYAGSEMSGEQVEQMKKRIEEAKMEKRNESRKMHTVRNIVAAAAAVAAVFVVLPNTSGSVAYAMGNLPVVGKLVEAVTFRDYQYDNGGHAADIKTPELTVKESDTEQMTDTEVQVQENLKKTTAEINAEIEKITDQIVSEFEESRKEEEGYQEVVVKHEVISTTDDYFTLKLMCYQAAGSGAEWDYYYTIDLKTGERLTLSDLFQSGADYITPISENIKEQMQQQMAKAQEDVENTDFTASAGGGAVQAVVSGKKELKALTIQPDAVDPQDVEMLQDLVISAVNEALRQADEAMNNSMNSFTGGLNIPGLM